MAVSRGTIAFFFLGTLLIILLFLIPAAEAEESLEEFTPIHAVAHTATGGEDDGEKCKGGVTGRGNQCGQDEQEDEEADFEFDDAYKVVDNVRISLSSTGKPTLSAGSIDSLYGGGEELDESEGYEPVVLGH